MRIIIALFRMATAALVLALAALAILITGLLPLHYRGERLVRWIPVMLARFALATFGVKIDVSDDDREQIRNHTGLLFANHDSMIDVVVLLTVRPFRFLAKAEVESWFLIGWIANRLGTLFFNRENKADRTRAREQLGGMLHDDKTPILLFPEGRINGKPELEPFRYGAFRLGIENGVDILPAALTFDPFDTASFFTIDNQAFFGMLWKLAKLPKMNVTITTLPTIHTTDEMDAPTLAEQTQTDILTILREKSIVYT